ncbi:PAS domain S-box protein [Desulfosediminicola flagellatus]|uniref:PAS domain S-box protein n=1 Tax=Desulfosediminicola flagellatus TaxID=2569541 RepID=UPI0010ABD899|nr:PAS domain S-box protein [Desulfosediminicola flagellatus]
MIERLLEQLEDSSIPLSDTWECYNQDYEDDSKRLISRQRLNVATLQIINGLKKITPRDYNDDYQVWNHALSEEISNFTKVAAAYNVEGISQVEFIYNIKKIWSFLVDCSDKLVASDTSKRSLSRALGKIGDCIELEVLKSWHTVESHDVTSEEKRSSKILAKEKATYKSIFDSTSNLVIITDGKGCITEINPEAKIRFSGQKIIDCPCWTVLGLPCSNIEQLFSYTQADTNQEFILPLSGVNQYFNLQVKSLSCMDSPAEGALLILSDITYMVDNRNDLEYRVVEKNRDLSRSQVIIDTIFQSVGQGILLLDNDLEVVEANMMASEMFGIPLEVLVGTSFQVLTDESGLKMMAHSRDTITDGEIRSLELAGSYVDGRQFPCMITIAFMDLDDQEFWPIIVSDISKQKELETRLVRQRQNAEEMNVTLRNVLATIEEQRKEVEYGISSRIRSSILPGIAKVANEKDEDIRSSYLTLVQDQLTSLTTGFDCPLDSNLLKLSKTELRICQFIKAGLSGKEIGNTMNLAFETIQSHRKNIRKKLGLRGQDINLYAFLAEKNIDSK